MSVFTLLLASLPGVGGAISLLPRAQVLTLPTISAFLPPSKTQIEGDSLTLLAHVSD